MSKIVNKYSKCLYSYKNCYLHDCEVVHVSCCEYYSEDDFNVACCNHLEFLGFATKENLHKYRFQIKK